MEDLFKPVLTNVDDVEYTSYPYYKNNVSLTDISVNDREKKLQTSKDINGLVQYVESMVTRNGKALSSDNNLGNLTSLIIGTVPQYNSITIETMTNVNENSPESHYITLADKDPVEEEKLKAFQRRSEPEKKMPGDPITQLYFATLGAIGLFIFYRLMMKSS